MQSELESTDIDSLAILVAKIIHVKCSIKGSLPSVLFDQSHQHSLDFSILYRYRPLEGKFNCSQYSQRPIGNL